MKIYYKNFYFNLHLVLLSNNIFGKESNVFNKILNASKSLSLAFIDKAIVEIAKNGKYTKLDEGTIFSISGIFKLFFINIQI